MRRPPNPHVRERERLRKTITDAGKTYADVGEAVGVHRSWIGALINGDRIHLTPEVALGIAQYLEVDPHYLFIFWTDAAGQKTEASDGCGVQEREAVR